MKYEGSNLQTYASALNIIVSCHILTMSEPFDASCFGHALSKACQYVTIDDKIAYNLNYAFIKSTQANIQKCITWPKKSSKSKQTWDKACIDFRLNPKKLNTYEIKTCKCA